MSDEYDEGWEDGYDAGRRSEREDMQPGRTETAAEIARLRARVAELEAILRAEHLREVAIDALRGEEG